MSAARHRSRATGGWLAFLALLATPLAGCTSDYWVRFSILTDAEPSVVVSRDDIQIPVGHAVAVRATAMQDDERMDSDTEIDLESLRPDVLGADHGARTDEFVIYGSRVGQTEVDVFFEQQWVDAIAAVVIEAG